MFDRQYENSPQNSYNFFIIYLCRLIRLISRSFIFSLIEGCSLVIGLIEGYSLVIGLIEGYSFVIGLIEGYSLVIGLVEGWGWAIGLVDGCSLIIGLIEGCSVLGAVSLSTIAHGFRAYKIKSYFVDH